VAERIFAHSITLGAFSDLAVLHRAANLTFWLITFDLALGASEFLTSGRALRRLAHGLAHLITNWFVTLPLTFGVAIISLTAVSAGIGASAILSANTDGHGGSDES